tara:strand:+ start:39824 stop:41920 length:2097 start_codon:yes stop_codon:yes gene_type:complete
MNNKDFQEILKGYGIPNFNKITSESIEEGIPILINILSDKLEALENKIDLNLKDNSSLTWESVIIPLHEIQESLRWSWGILSHLNGVNNNKKLREVYSNLLPEIIKFHNKINQNKVFFKAFKTLYKSKNIINNTQKRVLDCEILSMNNQGISLKIDHQKEFNKISQRLGELSTSFSNNVLDATNNWSLLLTKRSEVEGLPKRLLDIMATSAQKDKPKIDYKNGPWELGLDFPRYIPFITFSKNRALREKLYKAYVSRASKGINDNTKIIEEILSLRSKQSKLLGYKDWAELSLSSKMAGNIEEVENLLEELRFAAFKTSEEEIKALKECSQRNKSDEYLTFSPWDISYWSEILRKENFDLDQEALRPWFPLNQVLDGLFKLCERLFEITIKPSEEEVFSWHKDVLFFNVFENGKEIASFFLDPYSRPKSKRGGAWMDECISREKNLKGEITKPIAYLVCNQTPPSNEQPSLMSFEEVQTLFHEFGHGLQHMLTKIDYPQASGINNIEWDAVELPSQFMENWCYEKNTLNSIAKHWKTGEPLPEKEFNKLIKAKNFNSGLSTLRQVHFALTDIKLHSDLFIKSGISPNELRREIAKNTTILEPIKEDKFLCAFSHIFAGGYSAGYYSYKWAEVLSADAFSAFENILENEEMINTIGKQFKNTILSLGGSKSPNDIFKLFRGREPSTEALIRHSGLSKTI